MPLGLGQLSMAIAPDGTRLAYVLERQGVTQLYLHALDQLEAAPIPQTEGAFGPFFSPDGRWIGFFADNKLKKVAVSGGEPIDLCDAPNPYGGSWGTDGTILFAPTRGVVRRGFGNAVAFPSPSRPERSRFLQAAGYPARREGGDRFEPLAGVGVLSFDTGEFRLLVRVPAAADMRRVIWCSRGRACCWQRRSISNGWP